MRGVGALAALGLCACAPTEGGPNAPPSPFAVEVVSFSPGPGAGFGEAELPDVVFGAPKGGGSRSGSTDVVSLGAQGRIVLRLELPLKNEPGADLLVFENPFAFGAAGAPTVYTEPGEVAVSADNATWWTFPCDGTTGVGCAGMAPVIADTAALATDVDAAGGDAFDLDVAIDENGEPLPQREIDAGLQFVRITDVNGAGGPPARGFDLDAIAALNVP